MEPTWVRRSRNGTTVVFVHGILSSIEGAWLGPGGAFWPRLLCDEPTISDVGVYLFGYRADAYAGAYSLDDAVDSMREYFRLDHVWSEKQLIFACHSMGGIVARRFLISEQAEIIHADKRIGLFLVASPSLGATYADFVAAIAPIYNMQLDALRFSQKNAWLNALDKDFINLKERKRMLLFGKELVEDSFLVARRTFRRAQIVPPWSGAKYFGEPVKIPYSDHVSIAKPADSRAIQHRILVDFVRSAIRSSTRENSESPSARSDAIERSAVESNAFASNPVLVDWPTPAPLTNSDTASKQSDKIRWVRFLVVGMAALSVLGAIGFQLSSWLDTYRLEQALATPAEWQVLTGRTSWDQVPSIVQQPVPSGLSNRQLGETLRGKGNMRLDGVIQIPSSRTQASLYVHTLELEPNSAFITNGSTLTIVAARIVSQGGAIISYLPENMTAKPPGASGLSGGEVRVTSLTRVNGSLTISLLGQNGAKGRNGEPGAAGKAGGPGRHNVADCPPGPTGWSGEKGGQGQAGEPGGDGGHGGIVYLGRNLIGETGAELRIELSGGASGEGGNGGRGGPGGAGGEVAPALCGEAGGRPGQPGPVGDAGAMGPPGRPGIAGQIKQFDF